MIKRFSDQILILQENGDLTRITDAFISEVVRTSCENTVETEGSSITFMSLYGLWVILGGAILIGVFFMVVARWRRRRRGQQSGAGALWGPANGPELAASSTNGRPLPSMKRKFVNLGSIQRPESGEAAAGAVAAVDEEQGGGSGSGSGNGSYGQQSGQQHDEAASKWQNVVMSALEKRNSIFGPEDTTT